MEEIGPVDYAIVAFPGSRFRGEIAPAIGELVSAETIRVIDIAFVGKDEAGEVLAFELSELDSDVQDALVESGVAFGGLFNVDDVLAAAERLEPDSSAALVVWENVWARRLTDAVRDGGGVVLDFARLRGDVVRSAREWALTQV
jgi:hypothetical protein